jgi:hypothetical protein
MCVPHPSSPTSGVLGWATVPAARPRDAHTRSMQGAPGLSSRPVVRRSRTRAAARGGRCSAPATAAASIAPAAGPAAIPRAAHRRTGPRPAAAAAAAVGTVTATPVAHLWAGVASYTSAAVVCPAGCRRLRAVEGSGRGCASVRCGVPNAAGPAKADSAVGAACRSRSGRCHRACHCSPLLRRGERHKMLARRYAERPAPLPVAASHCATAAARAAIDAVCLNACPARRRRCRPCVRSLWVAAVANPCHPKARARGCRRVANGRGVRRERKSSRGRGNAATRRGGAGALRLDAGTAAASVAVPP